MSNIFEQVTKKTTIRTARHEIKTTMRHKKTMRTQSAYYIFRASGHMLYKQSADITYMVDNENTYIDIKMNQNTLFAYFNQN